MANDATTAAAVERTEAERMRAIRLTAFASLLGLVPTCAAIGAADGDRVAADPGLRHGREWGGAVLMAFEYAPPENRGLHASFPQIGFALGLCLSTGAIIFLAPLPILATLLVAWNGNRPWYLACYVAIGCAVSALVPGLMGQTHSGGAAGWPKKATDRSFRYAIGGALPLTCVRCMIRRVVASNGSRRCMVQRLSHSTRSPTRH